MEETSVPRDRQIRTEAVHAATRLGAGIVASGGAYRVDQWIHVLAHYIHSGAWLHTIDGDPATLDCPFGEGCRFNRSEVR